MTMTFLSKLIFNISFIFIINDVFAQSDMFNLYIGEHYPDSLYFKQKLLYKQDSAYYEFEYYGIHDYSSKDSDTVWFLNYNEDSDSTYIAFLFSKKEEQIEYISTNYYKSFIKNQMTIAEFDSLVDKYLNKMDYDLMNEDSLLFYNVLLINNTLDRLYIHYYLKNKSFPKTYEEFRKKINIYFLNSYKKNKFYLCKYRLFRDISYEIMSYNDTYSISLDKAKLLKLLWKKNDIRYKVGNHNKSYGILFKVDEYVNIGTFYSSFCIKIVE